MPYLYTLVKDYKQKGGDQMHSTNVLYKNSVSIEKNVTEKWGQEKGLELIFHKFDQQSIITLQKSVSCNFKLGAISH